MSDSRRSDEFLSPEILRIVRTFEKALRNGENPPIDAHLVGDGPDRWRLLLELVHSDLELRLRAGEPRELAEYLARYPDLAHFPNELAEVLETEVEFHTRAGRKLVPAEYEAKYPLLGKRVRALFRRVGDAPPEVPGYEVGDKLGAGGMGVVYRARQELLRRAVALKVIRGDKLGGTAAAAAVRARFRREAEAAGSVNHPNVVQVYETGEHDGDVFLAMELVDGPSLQQRLDRDGVFDPPAAAALVELVARAVHAVHGRGIVHRDLKPDNVLLTADGTPKVTDFGLARPAEVADGKTRAGVFVGTPEYSSPEQAAMTGGDPTPRTDVYGLGAVLYATLTGHAPFPRGEVIQTLEKVQKQAVVGVRELRSDCPRDLETIYLECLEKDPSRRYASAADLADDLRRWQSGEPIVARRVGPLERAWMWVKRNRAVSAAMLAVVLSVGSGVSLWKADVALRAEVEKGLQLARANDEFNRAEREADNARREAVEARRMLNRLAGTEGERRAEAGDLFGALAYFAAPLAWDADDPAAARFARERYQAHLRYTPHPRLTRVLASVGEDAWFTSDGMRLVTMGDETQVVFDLATGRKVGETSRWNSIDRDGHIALETDEAGHLR